MWLGIDVGGTFTDAVAVADQRLLAVAKTPTTSANLLEGIVAALDGVLAKVEAARIRRVALSTTIVTNTLVEGRLDPVALLLLPGPGLDPSRLTPAQPCILSGYVDHRGRVTAPPDREETRRVCRELAGTKKLAVAGKFAVRNPEPERMVAQWVRESLNPDHISLGAEMSGGLNFPRRANSAYYNAAVWQAFQNFAAAISTALAERRITAPVHILKADGGTMPMTAAAAMPVESIFTGPAASVLGIMALQPPAGEAVSLDIGGTTTDIALWRNGVPLFASGGARINGFPTAVRSFWLRSVGIGGDSYVRRAGEQLLVGPMRRGAAMSIGGPEPTVSDALRVAGMIDYGQLELAVQAMKQVALPGQTPVEAANQALAAAAREICRGIEEMIAEEAAAPVYKVEDIVRQVRFRPGLVVGVGGAAGGLAPWVAKTLGVPCQTPPGAMVANAIGAAVARPTTEITLQADTGQRYYTVPELGLRRELTDGRFTLAEAWIQASRHLQERSSREGISADGLQDYPTERIYEEEFPVVRGFRTTGKILTCKLQIKPGALTAVAGGEGM